MSPPERPAVEVPTRMRALPRDPRGYPIPFIVLIDKTGRPQFTINDVRLTEECRRKRLCAICGKRFDRDLFGRSEAWFVGGSRCFLHPRGAFVDPPMHRECAEYALRVCPFLAARSYGRRIDDKKLAPGATPDGMVLVRDAAMPAALPERFGLGLSLAHGYRETAPGLGIYMVDDWQYIEWWKFGEPCNAPDAADPPPIP